MNIIPYHLKTTNDLLTSRAGLVCIAKVMQSVGLSSLANTYFSAPKSNRGFQPSVFVNAMMLMLHEGGQCLDDLRHLRQDVALRKILGLKQVPTSDAMGDWLRRMGQQGVNAVTEMNRVLLKTALHHCQEVTLDIDATLSASHNKSAKWTYKKCKGYMPMVGHIAETEQIVATDFREGNVAPATDNLAFIKQCKAALPTGVTIKYLRVDAAGYQAAILDDCINQDVQFAIRAKMTSTLKQLIAQQASDQWQPLPGRDGLETKGEMTCRVVHTMQESQHPFTVIVQRKRLKGQQALNLEQEDNSSVVIEEAGYLYRAIATNRTSMSDSEIVHWYNQRAEHSENRIKELKHDFSADRMPCQDFAANALYFSLCALAYNLFALMRSLLPARFESCRAKTIRWRLYALAAKVVMHGRQVYLKCQATSRSMLAEVLARLHSHALGP